MADSLDDTFCPECGGAREHQELILCGRCSMPMLILHSTETILPWGHVVDLGCPCVSPAPLVGMYTSVGRIVSVDAGGGYLRARTNGRPIRFLVNSDGYMYTVGSRGAGPGRRQVHRRLATLIQPLYEQPKRKRKA